MIRDAVFLADGAYRPRLDRDLERDGYVALFLGVNPSKAGKDNDDHTITKLNGFCPKLGIGRYMVGNLFDYVATDVRELAQVDMPCSVHNNNYLLDMISAADIIIPMWGPLAKQPKELRGRWRRVVGLVANRKLAMHCFGVAKDGQPRHPLMLPYSTTLVRWNPPA